MFGTKPSPCRMLPFLHSHTPVRQNLGWPYHHHHRHLPHVSTVPANRPRKELEGSGWKLSLLGGMLCLGRTFLKHLWTFDMSQRRWSIPNSSHETGGRKPSDWNSTCKGDLECKRVIGLVRVWNHTIYCIPLVSKKNRLKEIPSWSWRPCTPVCALHEKLQGEEWSHSCSGHPHWPRAKDRIERNQGGSRNPRETNRSKTSESVNCLFQSFGSIV